MKVFAIIGIIISVLLPIFVALGLNEIYCSGSYSDGCYSYLSGDGVEITLLISLIFSLFFLAFSIISLVYAIRMKNKFENRI